MQECVGLTSKMAEARQIVCACEANPAPVQRVWADEQRLRQVLLNLLSNAIKYNREGGGVTVGCAQRPGNRWRLEVRDTGPGISSEDLGRLFVPFERLGHEYGKVEGSGLGLVVSKRLVEAMGGSLGADSQIGQGSTFWIELPGAENYLPPVAVLATAARPDSDSDVEASVTVVYIEDNLSNLQGLKAVLERLRPTWRFLCAKDGQAGIDLAREVAPTLILLDLQLPGMKGDAVLVELLNHPSTRPIPVMILSADATEQTRQRIMDLGASEYLAKPFQVQGLLNKIDRILPVRTNTEVTPGQPAGAANRPG